MGISAHRFEVQPVRTKCVAGSCYLILVFRRIALPLLISFS